MTIQRNHSQTLDTDHSLMTDDCSTQSPSEDGAGLLESGWPNPTPGTEGPDLDLAKLTDDQLMAHLSLGCNDALAVLFDRYHRLVFSIALRIVRDDGEAEDVVQNVFLDIFRFVGRFNPAKGSTKVWILQYAYHRAMNRRRHLSARNFYSQESIDEKDPEVMEVNSWYTSYSKNELRRSVKRSLVMLGQREKHVIELAAYEGLSMREIAEVTGETLVNVRHHYYRGLHKLRSVVDSTAPGPKDAASRKVDVR
jgi:RNA polymerase sigma-70 factor, ECF subfamily